jgi:Lrp/AsnC family transcriptional regulator
MDATDRKILQIVQADSSLSIAAIAAKVGLSQTPCWKRIQRLELEGVIRRRIALLDPQKLGLGITVFVTIEVGDHSRDKLEHFAQEIAAMEEVMDFYRMAGDVDYLLRVVVADTKAFDAFYKRLVETIPLKNVTSRFALESIKAETALPIHI